MFSNNNKKNFNGKKQILIVKNNKIVFTES